MSDERRDGPEEARAESLNALLVLALFWVLPWSALAGEPALLLFEKQPKSCSVKVQFVETKKTTSWLTLTECPAAPENFMIDTDAHRALVLQSGHYLSFPWAKDAKSTVFAEAYPLPSQEGVVASKTWIDKASGALRVAYLIEGGDWWRKKFPIVKKEWVKSLEAPGIASVALVAELASDGKWKELVAKPTTAEAEGAPGLAVVSQWISPKASVISLQDLLMKAICSEQRCESRKLALQSVTKKWIEGTFTREEGDGPAVSYTALSETDGLLYGVTFGDSFHAVPPVFYCTGNASGLCEKHEPIALSDDQLAFSEQPPYVLVTREYAGTSARVFKSGSKKPALTYPTAITAAWLTVDGLLSALRPL